MSTQFICISVLRTLHFIIKRVQTVKLRVYCDGTTSGTCKQQWFIHSSWTCTRIPESYVAPSSPHIPQPHSVLWFREPALFPPRHKPTMQQAIHSCPLTCGFIGPRSGHCVCVLLSDQQRFTAWQMAVRPALWWSAVLAFSLLGTNELNNQLRAFFAETSSTSSEPMSKGRLNKARWMNTHVGLPGTDFGHSPWVNHTPQRSATADSTYKLCDFSTCKQGRKDWAGTLNHSHLLHTLFYDTEFFHEFIDSRNGQDIMMEGHSDHSTSLSSIHSTECKNGNNMGVVLWHISPTNSLGLITL